MDARNYLICLLVLLLQSGASAPAAVDRMPARLPVRLLLTGGVGVEADTTTTTAVVTATLVPASTLPVTVTFHSLDGTATAGVDYAPVSTTLLFAPGTTVATLTVALNGDWVAEADETLLVQVASIANAVPVASETTVLIVDNDAAGLHLDHTSLWVAEAGPPSQLALALTSQPLAAVTLTLHVQASSQALVAPLTRSFTPANWSTPQFVTLAAVDDTVSEGLQTTELVLESASADPAYAGLSAQLPIFIADNDQAARLWLPLLTR